MIGISSAISGIRLKNFNYFSGVALGRTVRWSLEACWTSLI